MKKTLAFLPFLVLMLVAGSCKKEGSGGCPAITLTGTVTNSDAANGSIQVTASGSSGYTYSKDGVNFVSSSTFSGLAPGNYTITAKDSKGCTGSNNFTVNGTKTYFITRATWKFSGATVSGLDVSALLQTCQKDNILTFTTGGTGTNDEGATKCNAGDPQTNPFTWSFQSGETQLQVSSAFFTGGSGTFTIVSLTSTQMILSQQITLSGIPQTVVVTFIH